MFISKTSRRFREALAELPRGIQDKAHEAYALFRNDPNHPSLRFKRVSDRLPVYSARIDLNYRAVGIINGNEIVWFWIGPHAEYERLLDQF